MALLDYGPLIETGEFEGVTYELRGEDHPVLFAYEKVNGKWITKQTQLGNLPLASLVRTLVAELPK